MDENEVKAAFLKHFLSYTTWPETDVAQKEPIVIGTIGKDPFGPALNALVTKTVHGRPIVLRRKVGLDELGDCHLLFICASEDARLAEILDRLRGLPVLTVGETPGFAARGVMINFFTERNKVRFEVSLGSVKASSLKISSKLLRLARPVTPGGP